MNATQFISVVAAVAICIGSTFLISRHIFPVNLISDSQLKVDEKSSLNRSEYKVRTS